MQVSLGYRADTQFPQKIVGAMDVSSSERTKAFDFRGRIEDFPLPSGKQSKFPGLLIKVVKHLLRRLAASGKDQDRQPGRDQEETQGENCLAGRTDVPKIHVESMEFVGPVFRELATETSHRYSVSVESFATATKRNTPGKVLERFMTRAYRRNVSTDEIEPFLAYFRKVRPTTESLRRGDSRNIGDGLDLARFSVPGRAGRRSKTTTRRLGNRIAFVVLSLEHDAG